MCWMHACHASICLAHCRLPVCCDIDHLMISDRLAAHVREAISVPLLSSSRSVGEAGQLLSRSAARINKVSDCCRAWSCRSRYGNRSVASQLFLRPGTLPTGGKAVTKPEKWPDPCMPGYVNVYSQVCVNAGCSVQDCELVDTLLFGSMSHRLQLWYLPRHPRTLRRQRLYWACFQPKRQVLHGIRLHRQLIIVS